MTNTPDNGSVLQPVYYNQFFCTASGCLDTCCKGWNIIIDSQTHALWKTISEPPQLENCISKVYSANGKPGYRIRMNTNGYCPLLSSDGLCGIYIHAGEHAMPAVCKQFPRNIIESGSITQRYVSVRCPAVLDLLWNCESFRYQMIGHDSFPAKKLLDFFLDVRHHHHMSSATYLSWIFHSIYHIHSELSIYIPYEADGYRAFGQELITEDSIQKTISAAQKHSAYTELQTDSSNRVTTHFRDGSAPNLSVFETYHDILTSMTENFLDHPVYGEDFTASLSGSLQFIQNITADPDNTPFSGFVKNSCFDESQDKMLKLVIQEQLFSSVMTVQMTDYESILLALQWLIVQYTTIRYMLLIDMRQQQTPDRHLLHRRISRIFRISEIPDLGKLSFFDSKFRNWMWMPAKVDELLT